VNHLIQKKLADLQGEIAIAQQAVLRVTSSPLCAPSISPNGLIRDKNEEKLTRMRQRWGMTLWCRGTAARQSHCRPCESDGVTSQRLRIPVHPQIREHILLRQTLAVIALCTASAAQAAFVTVDFSSSFNHSFLESRFAINGGYPTGTQTLGGVQFDIAPAGTAAVPVNNFWHSWYATGANPRTLSITGLNIANAMAGYTLINTWWGTSDPMYAPVVTFTFADGSTTTRKLMGGVDVRDYNDATWTNTISGNTQQVWTNSMGQRFDMQTYSFGTNAGKTLTGFTLQDFGANTISNAFMSGLTIQTPDASAIPVPPAAWLLLSGMGLFGVMGRVRRS
jgi:hypothetical protein